MKSGCYFLSRMEVHLLVDLLVFVRRGGLGTTLHTATWIYSALDMRWCESITRQCHGFPWPAIHRSTSINIHRSVLPSLVRSRRASLHDLGTRATGSPSPTRIRQCLPTWHGSTPPCPRFRNASLHDLDPGQLALTLGPRFRIRQDQRLKITWMRMRIELRTAVMVSISA